MTPDALDKTIAALYEREVAYGEALDAHSEAKAAYETAYAEAFLNAVGAVEERKQTAVLACKRQSLAIDDLIATRLIERRSQGVFITRFFPAEKQG